MKVFLHVISKLIAQPGFILIVPVQSKRHGFSFWSHNDVGAPACVSWSPKARETPPTWVALLHVAIHVAGVVSWGHNDDGVHWVHGPSSNWRLSRRTRVFLYVLHHRTIKQFTSISFPFALFHFSSTFFCNFDRSLGLIIPQRFGDPISNLLCLHQQWDQARHPLLDCRPCVVVVWRVCDVGSRFVLPLSWVRLFLYLFSWSSTTSMCSATATSSAWWYWWWTWAGGSGRGVAHRGSPSSFFVDCSHCIRMCDISNTPASSTTAWNR